MSLVLIKPAFIHPFFSKILLSVFATPSCVQGTGNSEMNKAAPVLQELRLEGWQVWEELQGSMVVTVTGHRTDRWRRPLPRR